MEQIACKECTSPDCHGCNMYRLERMLMSGKLDALMDENRAIKMDADVRSVVRGKWIGTHDGFYYTYSCSECGYEALYKENTKDQVCSEFCPNCGAWMEES